MDDGARRRPGPRVSRNACCRPRPTPPPEVLAWEQRHLFAGSWTCLGRLVDLFPTRRREGRSPSAPWSSATSRPCWCTTARPSGCSPTPVATAATSCSPRASTSQRRSIMCPYHAWTYDLGGALIGAKGFRDDERFEAGDHGLVELPVQVWEGWVFGHALHPLGSPLVPSFTEHLGDLAGIVAPYALGTLVLADRHTYEVAANWKVIAENYHECYHCPLIHPELCQVSPPDSGDNYDLPGVWVGGSMVLRDGMATMSMTGELAAHAAARRRPDAGGVPPRAAEPAGLGPSRLRDDPPAAAACRPVAPGSSARGWLRPVPTVARPTAPRCGRLLGPDQQAGLGGVRVGAAWTGQPALPAGPVRAQRGRRRGPGGHDQPGLPPGTVPAMSGWIRRL